MYERFQDPDLQSKNGSSRLFLCHETDDFWQRSRPKESHDTIFMLFFKLCFKHNFCGLNS